jgi:hypothetical protein
MNKRYSIYVGKQTINCSQGLTKSVRPFPSLLQTSNSNNLAVLLHLPQPLGLHKYHAWNEDYIYGLLELETGQASDTT